MAIRFDGGSSTQLTRTTNLPSATAHTFLTWAYPVTIPGAGVLASAVCIGPAPISGLFYAIGVGNTNRVGIYNANNGALNATGATVVSTNTWYHLAQTVAGTGTNQMIGYLNGVQELTTTSAGTVTASTLYAGNSAGGDPFNGRMAAIKIYGAVLTADEIRLEMRSYLPVRFANLLSWHPMLTHTDTAQYGTAWTAAGTLTTEQGPPIAWSLRTPSTARAFAVAAAAGLPMSPMVRLQAVPRAVL